MIHRLTPVTNRHSTRKTISKWRTRTPHFAKYRNREKNKISYNRNQFDRQLGVHFNRQKKRRWNYIETHLLPYRVVPSSSATDQSSVVSHHRFLLKIEHSPLTIFGRLLQCRPITIFCPLPPPIPTDDRSSAISDRLLQGSSAHQQCSAAVQHLLLLSFANGIINKAQNLRHPGSNGLACMQKVLLPPQNDQLVR